MPIDVPAVIIIAYRDVSGAAIDKNKEILLDSLHLSSSKNIELNHLYPVLDQFCNAYSIKSINSLDDGSTNILLGVSLENHNSLSALLKELKTVGDPIEVSFYNSPSS